MKRLYDKGVIPKICLVFGFLTISPLRPVGQQPSVGVDELPSRELGSLTESLASFEVAEGFRIEPVAWEPLVVDPVAMAFDEWGRLYVVEMRDYSERRPERLGRVRRLEDRDGDGVMEHSSIFVDDLPWPTAVICYDGGVFIGSTPDILYAKDEDGDGVAEHRRTVFTGFASDYAPYETNRLNVQALLNSFRWGIDNRIHGVTSGSGGKVVAVDHPEKGPMNLRGRDFSFDPRRFDIRPEGGGAQHGMSFDDWGQKFVCSNSDHIQQVVLPAGYEGLNRHLPGRNARVSIADDGAAAPVYRLSPDEPWRVIRTRWRVAGQVGGPVEGGGRPSGYFTGATGVTIYRGDQWPRKHVGNALIADCGSNLIHRKRIVPGGLVNTATRYAEDREREFVASRENWFRPVQFGNAPDGCLWVLDMAREVIEHPWSLPENIKRHLDLNHGNQAGRVYRIVSSSRPIQERRILGGMSTQSLVDALEHRNGWHRDTAARLLIESGDPSVGERLKTFFYGTRSPEGRIHALYLMQSLGEVGAPEIVKGLSDSNPAVRVHSLRCLELNADQFDDEIGTFLAPLFIDKNEGVLFQLALSIGHLDYPRAEADLYRLSRRVLPGSWLDYAVRNSAGPRLDSFWALIEAELDFWQTRERRRALIDWCRQAGPALSESARGQALEALSGLDDIGLAGNAVRAMLDGSQAVARVREQSRQRLARLVARAIERLGDQRTSPRDLGDILELLVALRVAGVDDLMEQVLAREVPSALVTRCLRMCRQVENPSLILRLAERFPQFLPESRREFLALLFSRRLGLDRIVDWLEDGTIGYRDLDQGQRDLLIEHSDESLRSRAQTLLRRPANGGQQALDALRPALLLEASPNNGRRLFVERCALCHRLNDLGSTVGPAVESMRGLRKRGILEAILFPNREVAPQYFGVTVTGESIQETGILVGDSGFALSLRQAGGAEVQIPKSDVVSIKSGQLSLMPEGLLEGMSVREVADLLEFLMYGGEEK